MKVGDIIMVNDENVFRSGVLVDGSIITKIDGDCIHFITPYEEEDWIGVHCFEEKWCYATPKKISNWRGEFK